MFEVSAADPLTLIAVAAVTRVAAVTASLVPAYRAARLDSLDGNARGLISVPRERRELPSSASRTLC